MSGQALTRYDAARKALAEARRVDEVKSIHDKAAAMQLYAKQAKDRDLIKMATEIRMRAEDRAGELLAEMKKQGKRQKVGDNQHRGSNKQLLPPKLSELGVTKVQSSRWQRFAALSPDEKEKRIAAAIEKAEAAVDTAAKQPRKPKPKKEPVSMFSFAQRQVLATNNVIKRLFKALSTDAERTEFLQGIRRIIDDLSKREAA